MKNTNDNSGLYDLSLLKDLRNNNAMEEILGLIINRIPRDFIVMQQLLQDNKLPELYELAHKLKGTFSILRTTAITGLLQQIESDAKSGQQTNNLADKVSEAVLLSQQLHAALLKEYITLTQSSNEADKEKAALIATIF